MTAQIDELRVLLGTLNLRVTDRVEKKLADPPAEKNPGSGDSGDRANWTTKNGASAYPVPPKTFAPTPVPPRAPTGGSSSPPSTSVLNPQSAIEVTAVQQKQPALEPPGTENKSSTGLISSLWNRFLYSADGLFKRR